MRSGQQDGATGKTETGRTEVLVLTADAAFETQARQTFGASERIMLRVVPGALAGAADLDLSSATVAVVDLDASARDEMAALERLIARIGTQPPVVVITQAFDE